MKFLTQYPLHQKVYYLTAEAAAFEEKYLAVRSAEGRLYEDQLVGQLPKLPRRHRHYQEWRMRKPSTLRLLRHLSSRRPARLLDLGCGNGWLSHRMADLPAAKVLGIDLNKTELEQAARLFSSPACQFAYANIFEAELPAASFDAIVLNSCIQYFPSLSKLLDRLLELIKDDGSVHILDSPMYARGEEVAAQQRTKTYYKNLGFPEMAAHYFHHSWAELGRFKYHTPYNPQQFLTRIRQRLFIKDSPFPWVIVQKR